MMKTVANRQRCAETEDVALQRLCASLENLV
jgi:hypothetical protein